MRDRLQVVVVEEHHEAFYVWHYARKQGWISAGPATLLHVDEHRDMALPVFRSPLPQPETSLREIARFTYADLSLTTFVWAGVLCGFVDRVLWMRVQHDALAGGWRRIGISPQTPARRSFVTTAATGFEPLPPGQAGVIEFAPITAQEQVSLSQNCVLDIDLDYFCWNDYPELGHCCVDVPEETFREVQCDPYHFLRLSMNAKIAAIQDESGGYKIALQHLERPAPVVTPRAIVAQRIDAFVEFLSRSGVRPSLAVICQSRHSGWVQSANVDFAARTLLDRLASLFTVEQHHLDELLDGHFYHEDVFAPPVEEECFPC